MRNKDEREDHNKNYAAPTLTHLLYNSPRSTELAQDGFHRVADCADQHCRDDRHYRLNCGGRTPTPLPTHVSEKSKPFFSWRHRGDGPAPLGGRLTSSPIHDAPAFGTEPANEALRTADSEREGATADEQKKQKISQMEYNK